MTLAAFLSLFIGSGMEGGLLLVLFALSASMETMVSEKTKTALLSLHRLSPRFACVISPEGILFEKTLREISIGTHLLIKAGEIVPLDGKVVKGSSFVNLFHLTGESHPVPKTPGEELQAGAYNLDGTLTIEVTRTSGDSTLNRIINLITQAQEAKPKLQRFLDRFGKTYAMTIIALFFLFALTLPLIFSLPYLGDEGSLYRALSFLIAASPCALIIATPTAYLSAISSCAKRGVLLKGGVVLDALTRCKAIAFDKTGTLTTGRLSCVNIEALAQDAPICNNKEALSIAYALEQNAVHPIADAIAKKAQEEGVRPYELLSFKAVAGFGLEGTAFLEGEAREVSIGHAGFIADKIPPSLKTKWDILSQSALKEGHMSTILLIKDTLFIFHFTDTLRPQSKPLITRLKERGVLRPLMLTGDHADIARRIASEVGITEVHANLRPEDKLAKVGALSESEGLAMIGDGVNDAPALARATVGISLGKIGSATAVDASDIVFLNDDLLLLDWVFEKANKTKSIVRQNISLALGVIFFASIPALLGLIPLWVAVILHEGGTVLVGLNSLRLLRTDLYRFQLPFLD